MSYILNMFKIPTSKSGWWFGTCFYDFPLLFGSSSSQLTFTPSCFRGLGIPPTRNIFLVLLKIHEHPHVPKVLVNSPKSSTKKNPATQAWEEAQKRPPPIVQAAKAKAQRSPTWLAEAGLWVIWLDDELDSHCWSWEAKDCWKKHVNPVEIDWDDGSWPNLVRM